MKMNIMLVFAGLTAVAMAGGCASHDSRASGDFASLAALGPATGSGRGDQDTYLLGAGDALGRAVFANYIAHVRANGEQVEAYAGGEPAR